MRRPSRSIAPRTEDSASATGASGVYLLLLFLPVVFLALLFLLVVFLLPVLFFFGTLAPARRASLRPMAIACFLLVTFLPEPLRSVPCLRSCIVFLTFDCAVVLRAAMTVSIEMRVA